MGHSPSRESLQPATQTPRPPWANRALGAKKYDGRAEWWAEPGYKQHPSVAGQWRDMYPYIKEHDPIWYDPPVEDGTSISGPFGLDSMYNKNFTIKADQPGDFFEFQKKVMEGSVQYKQIAEKYELSPEHPGLGVNATMKEIVHKPHYLTGKNGFLQNSWSHFGPRFWDEPMNEGCFTKGFCLAKYVAAFALPYTLLHIKSFPPEFYLRTGMWKPRHFAQLYVRLLPVPSVCAFTYGVSLCTSANIRDSDDYRNYWAAGGMTGLAFSAMKDNVAAGITVFIVTSMLGLWFQWSRTENKGLQGAAFQQKDGGLFVSSPLFWQWMKGKDRPIPTDKYKKST